MLQLATDYRAPYVGASDPRQLYFPWGGVWFHFRTYGHRRRGGVLAEAGSDARGALLLPTWFRGGCCLWILQSKAGRKGNELLE